MIKKIIRKNWETGADFKIVNISSHRKLSNSNLKCHQLNSSSGIWLYKIWSTATPSSGDVSGLYRRQ